MNQDTESRLRSILRPVAPSDEFTHKLLAQVAAPAIRPGRTKWWLSAGIAASLLLAAGVQYEVRQARERADGLEARRQVVEALRMTSQKLNLAYETVKGESGV